MNDNDLDTESVVATVKVLVEHISRVMGQVSLNSKEELRDTLIPLFSYSILEKYVDTDSYFRYCFFLILDELWETDNWILFALIETYPFLGINLIEFGDGVRTVLGDMSSYWFKSLWEDLTIVKEEIKKYPNTFNRIQTTELKGRIRSHG